MHKGALSIGLYIYQVQRLLHWLQWEKYSSQAMYMYVLCGGRGYSRRHISKAKASLHTEISWVVLTCCTPMSEGLKSSSGTENLVRTVCNYTVRFGLVWFGLVQTGEHYQYSTLRVGSSVLLTSP